MTFKERFCVLRPPSPRLPACACLALFVLLAACGGSQTQIPPSMPLAQTAPNVIAQDLLYVSDTGTRDVYVYTYREGRLVQILTGFSQPMGLCSDKKGDVFVSDPGAADIVEYAHGRKKPSATLQDPGEVPVDCSFDEANGDLAVENAFTVNDDPGSVSIYKHASGSATTYADPNMADYYSCSYDNAGNLFISGLNLKATFLLAELPKGSTKFTDITIDKKYPEPGGIQWDGKYLAVGAENGPKGAVLTRFQISGSRGTPKGETLLYDSGAVFQFAIPKVGSGEKNSQGTEVVAPSFNAVQIGLWKYPHGGNARKVITCCGLYEPRGAAVSKGTSH